MCNDASFVQDRAGKIYDLAGITESHTDTAATHKLDGDKCNKWEWTPDTEWDFEWTGDGWQDFLREDSIVFTPPQTHFSKIKTYLKGRFPDRAAWDAPRTVDEKWHMEKVVFEGREVTVVCRDIPEWHEGEFVMSGGTLAEMYGGTLTRMSGGTLTEMYGGTLTRMSGGTLTEMYGGTLARMYGGTLTEMSGGTLTEMYGGTLAEMSGGTLTRMSGGTLTEMYGGTLTEMYGGTLAEMYGGTLARMYGGTLTEMSGGTLARMYGGTLTEMSGGTLTEMYGGTLAEMSGGTLTRMSGGTLTEMYGGTLTRMSGGTLTEMYGGTLAIPEWFAANPTLPAEIKDRAVLIDRRNGGLVITTAKGTVKQ